MASKILIFTAGSLLLLLGCTNTVPETAWLKNIPDRAKIENDYLGFKGTSIPYGKEMELTDSVGNRFDLSLSHKSGEYRYFAAKKSGLIIKTGAIYSILVKDSHTSSSPIPIVFESSSSSSEYSPLPNGGLDGQILTVVSGSPAWSSLTLGSLASKNTINDADINDVSYGKINGLPASFPPSLHTHSISDVSNLQSALDSSIPYATPTKRQFRIFNDGATLGVDAIDIQNSRSTSVDIAGGVRSIAIGYQNRSSDSDSLAIGNFNKNDSVNSVAIGRSNTVNGDGSVAIGLSNSVSSITGKAVGYLNNVKASATNGVAIGSGNSVSQVNSVVIGNDLNNDIPSSVMMGDGLFYKIFIANQIKLSSSILSHQNAKIYCQVVVVFSNGSFSKGFVVLGTDANANITLLASSLKESFWDASTASVLTAYFPNSTTFTVQGNIPISRKYFECYGW